MDPVEELRAAIHRDPRAAADGAHRLAAAARSAGDWAQLSRCLAVLGRARRSLGEIELAERDLTEAMDAARRVRTEAPAEGADDLEADARVGLAGVLSFAGRAAAAFEHLAVADRIGGTRTRAYAALQRAIIEQRLGRSAEALAGFEAALPTLRTLGADLDIALVLMNRGVLRTRTGDCAGAIDDLTESGGLFATLGNDFGVAQTFHGLGLARARQGDIPPAMRDLDEATARFRLLGHAALEVDADRCEVLLAAGLYADAAELAQGTAGRLLAAGNSSLAAEVWLLSSRAALLDDDWRTAADYATRARDLFAAQDAAAWEQLARLEQARCGPGAHDATALQALAEGLQRAGNARGRATALGLGAAAACAAGDLVLATELAGACADVADRLGLFEVRMHAAEAAATVAAAQGDSERAEALVAAAAEDLARHRVALAATDARAAVAVHARGLAGLGLSLAHASGSATRLLAAMERARAGRGRHVAAEPPQDAELAARLTELRAVARALRGPEADPAELVARQRELEQAVRRRLLAGGHAPAAPGPDGPATVDPDALAGALGDAVLVELAASGGRLLAVTVDATGARAGDVGSTDAVQEAATSLRAALRTALTPGRSAAARAGAIARLHRTVAETDRRLAGLVPAGDGPLILVVPPALHALPWSLLPRFGRRPIAVAPSATWWLTAVTTAPETRPGGAALAAGPRLTEADAEVLGVAAHHPGGRPLTGAEATAGAVLGSLATAAVAHLVCHGRIRHDNPLWSALEFSDGPLYVYDLERLAGTPPFVVLSGCDTGLGVRAGDQLLGLATAFLDRGTRSLVAALSPLPDSPATREVMVELHRLVAAGRSPAAALRELTVKGLGSDGPSEDHALVAACLACFGSA